MAGATQLFVWRARPPPYARLCASASPCVRGISRIHCAPIYADACVFDDVMKRTSSSDGVGLTMGLLCTITKVCSCCPLFVCLRGVIKGVRMLLPSVRVCTCQCANALLLVANSVSLLLTFTFHSLCSVLTHTTTTTTTTTIMC